MSNFKAIGTLSEERLVYIHPKYHAAHEFCFYIHDQLVQLLLQYEESNTHNLVPEALSSELEKYETDHLEIDLLEFLKEPGLEKPYRHFIVSHTVLALTADMLHFLYEALACFEKGKYSVAFSLLRKPLKEHLLYLAWIAADEQDFVSRFENEPHKGFDNISKETRYRVLEEAIKSLKLEEAFDAETLWNMVYSKKHSAGFEPTWQQATHLVTSRGELLRTPDYSLNFIFNLPFENEYQNLAYSNLPYLLIFVMQVALVCFNKIHVLNDKTVDHLIITTMGCYEALFLKHNEQEITKSLRKDLAPFLKCLHCREPLKIYKKDAPRFYLLEEITCKSCGISSTFPLYWLLAYANTSVTKTG